MDVAVSELISRAREYADARDDGDSPYISDAALLAWLNQENRRLVRRAARLQYPVSTTTTAFTSTTTLTDLVAIIGVEEVSGTYLKPLPRLQESVRNRTDGRFYRVTRTTGSNVVVSVGMAGTYQVRYVPTPPTLVISGAVGGQDTQTHLPAGWEEVLVLGAALRAKAKEGSDAESPLLRQLYQDEWEDVEVEAANSQGQDTVVRNVDVQTPPGYAGTNGPDYTLGWWYP